ncbi:MAG: hypothetical protein HZA81_00305 [Candidatus Taylorbacteria bacterium]|nr:hypothetical protein [Candidatus Taylorbacteria bacterium]
MQLKDKLLVFAKGTGKAGKFFVTERIITVATRIFTDVPMLAFIVGDPEFGWLKAIVFVTPLYVMVCIAIVLISDFFLKNGVDITGIEEARALSDENLTHNQFTARFVRWFTKRRLLIFWVGSIYYLDPDYVTLLLRRKEDGLMKTTIKITVPSVLLSMLFWSTLYWLIYQPFKHTEWAQWLAERI